MTTSNVQIQTRAAAPRTTAPQAGGCGCGGCGCGAGEVLADPEIDARAISTPVRHAAVLGALSAVGPGEALVVIAHRNPTRLRTEVKAAFPDAFDVTVLEAAPEAWKIRFARR
jgi:uncharacterized protein (DUF2249 family)